MAIPIVPLLTPRLNLADVWEHENNGRAPRPSLHRLAETLLPEAEALITPAAIFDLFPVCEVRHDCVVLKENHRLHSPDAARLLAPAKEILVSIVTIGSALEERASRYFAEGEPARGYLLDCLGTAAVTDLVQQVCAHVESLAAMRGWLLGFPLSPGGGGWSVTDQRVLFDLLPAHTIGVRLSDSYLMIPKKSVSFVVGIGPEILTAAGGSQCDYCSLHDSCRYRHHPA